MLESLLVLGLVSILALGLSGSVQSTFAAVEEQIFFMEFEELYRLDKNDDASLSKLQADGRITAEQAKAYKDYHAKQKTSQTVAD